MSIRLAFGTAGIRATVGPGDDQLNLRTVGAIAHALASYLGESFPGAHGRGLCIGFDGRADSARFAQEVERVARSQGFRVRAFEQPVPTPLLAFCTRYHDAAAGVMITASHNPPDDNGVKIYMERGAQVLAPHDRAIAERIASFDAAQAAGSAAEPTGVRELLGELEIEAYLGRVERLVERPSSAPLPPIAYSALCGVGSALTRRLFVRAGAHDVHEVAAQAEPRADFGGLSTPNPEHPIALARLLARAEEAHVGLAFAHDPDADRLAVLVRASSGQLQLLSGDEVGALLGSFMLELCPAPDRALLVSTLVSGELLERIAQAHGARFERTPTGFKWIAARARTLEREAGLHFLFGYEEAIGYAFGSMADDKDGIAALYVLLELARRLHANGRTLLDELDTLFARHGLFVSRQLSLPRAVGQPSDLLTRLRAVDPTTLLGAGATATDYRERSEAVDLLVFRAPDGSRLCARPSGTEPKLKFYLHSCAEVTQGELVAARALAGRRLDAIEAALRRL
jgi:phosphomannomutase